MTADDLLARIATHPACARHWQHVFVAPDDPEPTDPAQAAAWRVKHARAGRLHPDAAAAIAQILSAEGDVVTPRAVIAAKQAAVAQWLPRDERTK